MFNTHIQESISICFSFQRLDKDQILVLPWRKREGMPLLLVQIILSYSTHKPCFMPRLRLLASSLYRAPLWPHQTLPSSQRINLQAQGHVRCGRGVRPGAVGGQSRCSRGASEYCGLCSQPLPNHLVPELPLPTSKGSGMQGSIWLLRSDKFTLFKCIKFCSVIYPRILLGVWEALKTCEALQPQ